MEDRQIHIKKYIVIDDEDDGRSIVKHFMTQYFPEWKLVGEADGLDAFHKLVDESNFDLVFLDIRMNNGLCFDILQKLDRNDFFIIFVTAHQNYTLKSFEYNVIDYLLKPIDVLEFHRALEKANRIIAPSIENSSSTVILKTMDAIHHVEKEKIIRVESEGNYCNFYIEGRKPIMVSKCMKEMENSMGGLPFIRVHQSHLVNINYIKSFIKQSNGNILLHNGTEVPVSRRKKEHLLSFLK